MASSAHALPSAHVSKQSRGASGVPALVEPGQHSYLLRIEDMFAGKTLGLGGTAVVYEGRCRGMPVAIKVLAFDKNKAHKPFAVYEKEATIISKLAHPNVVKFVGVCLAPPRCIIVMELLRGGSVYDLLHGRLARSNFQRVFLDLRRILQFASDAACGMEYIHAANIVHRDLKSPNLLLTETNQVKVSDFGLARRMSGFGGLDMTPETGTYRWMAPEVIQHNPYDHRVDVYSFGIVLWELCTSEAPFRDLAPIAAVRGVVHQGLRPNVPDRVHPAIAALMHRCWHSQPGLRPEFTEILQHLAAVAAEAREQEAAALLAAGSPGGADGAPGPQPVEMWEEYNPPPQAEGDADGSPKENMAHAAMARVSEVSRGREMDMSNGSVSMVNQSPRMTG